MTKIFNKTTLKGGKSYLVMVSKFPEREGGRGRAGWAGGGKRRESGGERS
jgi:hypothetical protein